MKRTGIGRKWVLSMLSHDGFKVLIKCPLCNESAIYPLYDDVRDRHYGIKGTYSVAKCSICALVFLNPLPNEDYLRNLYPDDYYSYQNNVAKKSAFITFVKRLLFVNIETKDPVFPEPGRMLDVGCGTGWFIRGMKQKGWQVYGVEINRKAAMAGRQVGLEISDGNLKTTAFAVDNFDYVRLNHSFEHMINPNEILNEIFRIIKPTGKLLIGVPNIDSFNARLFKQFWWYLGTPVHPFNYSVKTLMRILERHNFVIEKVSYNSDYSGILGSLQIFLNRHTDKLSHEGMVFNNPALKVLAHWTSKALDLLKQGDAIEIIAHKGKG